MTELQRFYSDQFHFELSMDEAGRGCLFGRVYVACVVLPKDIQAFSGKDIKDSKKFSKTSKKPSKIQTVAAYIKEHAYAWHVAHVDSSVIDEINILKAVMQGMHECIREVLQQLHAKVGSTVPISDCLAVVDGNYFTPYRIFDASMQCICEMTSVTVEQGDAKMMAIAAASILAKMSRDEWIAELCIQHPDLIEKYGLDTNMGYGTKKHLEGIREFGITAWHRRTFGSEIRMACEKEG